MTSLQLINSFIRMGQTESQTERHATDEEFQAMVSRIEKRKEKHFRILCEGSRIRKWFYRMTGL